MLKTGSSLSIHKRGVGEFMAEDEKNPFELTIEELMQNLNAEDDEKPYIENVLLVNAKAYVRRFINRDEDTLSDDDKTIMKHATMMTATDWYYNRAGEGNLNKKSYSGMNTVLETIRDRGIGFSSTEGK